LNVDLSNNKTWEKAVANNIIIVSAKFTLKTEGKHTLKIAPLDAGIVMQKIVLDFGGVKPSYLGPPENRE
jgi:hypothetical protein